MSLGSVGHDGDRVSDLFFNKLDIVAAVQGKIFVFPDAADVALPSGKGDVNGFCPGEESGHRKFLRPDAVDFVGDTDGDFIEVAQDIENSKRYIGRALQAAAVTGRNTVVPAHAAGSAGGGAVFAAIAASSAQFIRFFPEDLGDKFTRADCGGVCLVDYNDLADGIRRDSRSDRAEGRQCRRGSDHGINAFQDTR